jgi:hypothetical protein
MVPVAFPAPTPPEIDMSGVYNIFQRKTVCDMLISLPAKATCENEFKHVVRTDMSSRCSSAPPDKLLLNMPSPTASPHFDISGLQSSDYGD